MNIFMQTCLISVAEAISWDAFRKGHFDFGGRSCVLVLRNVMGTSHGQAGPADRPRGGARGAGACQSLSPTWPLTLDQVPFRTEASGHCSA